MAVTADNLLVVLEASPDAMLAVDGTGRITLVNSQTEALFGYDPGELLGQPVETLVPERHRHVHVEHRTRYAATTVTRPMGVGLELAGQRSDGSEFPAEISLSAIDTDAGRLVLAAVRDVTDRRQAAIVGSTSDAIMSTTIDGTITSWNPGAERLYGYLAADALGGQMAMLLPPALLAEEQAVLRRVASGESLHEYESVRVRADGTEVHVACTTAPIRDRSGAVTGASSIARDISERKHASAERHALEERLRRAERLESLGQLAGGIAHDFNNLLGVILNYATFVAEEVADRPAAQADLDKIRAAAERAAALTHQLLLFGRQETAPLAILDLNSVVTEIESLLSRTIGEHVELSVRAATEVIPVNANRGQVEQVLVNLAVNARDAMPDGGRLTIETSIVDVDDSFARLHPDLKVGRYAQLSVSDTGTGMPPDVLERVFEPFFTTKSRGHGTGLGLATVYGITAAAGGTVSIYSEPGLGTTVRVYLPVADEAITPRPRPTPRRPTGRGETILVVEDEAALLEVTARILRRAGYTVVESLGGDHALDALGAQAVDLLLTDVVMPVMSGPELVSRARQAHPDLVVLFMSGYSQGVLGPQRGFDDDVALIHKPFNEEQLVDQVQAALTARRG
jgi:PAS domain S-box-containing protein